MSGLFAGENPSQLRDGAPLRSASFSQVSSNEITPRSAVVFLSGLEELEWKFVRASAFFALVGSPAFSAS